MANYVSWQQLPQPLLTEIYDSLSLPDKLSASSACKAWREALFTPRLLLLDDLKIRLPCSSGQHWPGKEHAQKVIRQVKSITFEWSVCCRDEVLQLVEVLQLPLNQLRDLTLNPRDRKLCKSTCSISLTTETDESFNGRLVDFILKSTRLASVSLGYDLELSRIFAQTASTHGKPVPVGQTLRDLNLACVTDRDGMPSPVTALQTLGSKLVKLGLCWDPNLHSVLDMILAKSLTIKELELVVDTRMDFHGALIPPETWWAVTEAVPGLEVSVTAVETRDSENNNMISPLMVTTVPLVQFTLIYQNTWFAMSVVDQVLTHFKGTLKNLGVHVVRGPTGHFDSYFIDFFTDRLMDDFDESHDTRVLREIAFSGCVFAIGEVKALLTRNKYVDNLNRIRLSRHDITADHIIIDAEEAEINAEEAEIDAEVAEGLERAVSARLGREWKAIPVAPIQRTIKGRENRIPEVAKYILQDLQSY